METYNQAHPGEDLKQRAADQVITHILSRISKEPQLVDKLRFYSKDIRKPQLAGLKPPAKMVISETHELEPVVARKPVDPHLRAVLSNMVGDIRAFCSETALTEDFLYTLDLGGLSRLFVEHKIKLRSATACVAEVIRRQSETDGIGLTSGGLGKALDAMDKKGFVVRELKADTTGPPIHVGELAGKYKTHILYLNPENALEITDDSLLEFTKPKQDVVKEKIVGSGEDAVGPIGQIPPMELPGRGRQ